MATPTNPAPSEPNAREMFYRAALVGLRALDAREPTPRRFGSDADGRWTQFAGALGAGDRLDILLRDAAGTWGAAFSPSECFGFFGLVEDEPFGPDWRGLDDRAASNMLGETDAPVTLEHVARELGVRAHPVPTPATAPSTKLIVAGGSAILSVAVAFSKDKTLSWTDQVAVVADLPEWRQLAGLAAVLVGARGRTLLMRPTQAAVSELRAAGFAHLDAAVVSPDAEPEAAEFAGKVGGK